MKTFDFEREEEIAAALVEAVKAHAPPAGLQEAIRERLFGQTQDTTFLPDPRPAGAKSTEPQVAYPAARPKGLTKRCVARYAAGLAVAASLLVVLAIWGGHGDIAANIAFADVQEAIRHIETAIEVVDWTKTPWLNHRSLYRNDSEVLRMEWPNGIICLCDTKQRRELTLNPKQKTA